MAELPEKTEEVSHQGREEPANERRAPQRRTPKGQVMINIRAQLGSELAGVALSSEDLGAIYRARARLLQGEEILGLKTPYSSDADPPREDVARAVAAAALYPPGRDGQPAAEEARAGRRRSRNDTLESKGEGPTARCVTNDDLSTDTKRVREMVECMNERKT